MTENASAQDATAMTSLRQPGADSQALGLPPPETSGDAIPEVRNVAGRDAAGRFLPGASGNPGGPPEIPKAVKALAREHTIEALGLLIGMARDMKVPPDIRRRCCNDLLDRAWGKTPMIVKQEGPQPASPGVSVNVVNVAGGERLSPAQARALIREGGRPDVLAAAEQVLLDQVTALTPAAVAVEPAESGASNVIQLPPRGEP